MSAATRTVMTDLYARWKAALADYLSDDGRARTDAEIEVLGHALDDAEDRLSLEPVRCEADILVKAAFFLSEMARMGADSIVPRIDATAEEAFPRLIPSIEASAGSFATELQAPLRDLAGAVRGVVDMLGERYAAAASTGLAAGLNVLVELETHIIAAEGAIQVLLLVADGRRNDEIGSAIGYLGCHLEEHLTQVRRQWLQAKELISGPVPS